jgi:phenylalanyl-tRNA synthetase beta chain
MKFTYNWLRDFVEIKMPAQRIADKLTMAGIEVTSLEKAGGDFVFEAEITSNRPDWLSVLGIAREVAAITHSRLKRQKTPPAFKIKTSPPALRIHIENKQDCPLYTAKIIQGVKVGPSPEWLRERLELIGCRSINNVVDITNYVLFSFGEPLHAFDWDKLFFNSERYLVVRRALSKEGLLTIDGINRFLDQDILVIAAGTSPGQARSVAIAGIMGGKEAEVTDQTKDILLEAAIFNPALVRRARQRLGLNSDSSYRFERGVDCATVELSSAVAEDLIEKVCSGRCILNKATGKIKTEKRSIFLETATVNKVLGTEIKPARIKSILSGLGFHLQAKTKRDFKVGVPLWRQDVNLAIDLIEEISRIFGYEHIPKTLAATFPSPALDKRLDQVARIKNILLGLGLNEVITYSLIDRQILQAFDIEPEAGPIEIMNPLSKEQEVLRPGLLASLGRCIAFNLNQKQEYVPIFEIANVFSPTENLPKEEMALGIATCGTHSFLVRDGQVKDEVSLLHLKGILEALFERLGIKEYKFSFATDANFNVFIAGERVGLLKRLSDKALENLDIKNKDVFVSEINLDRLLSYAQAEKMFAALPKYPGIRRDISVILKEGILLEEIFSAIREKAGPLLADLKLTDYYQGKQIPSGFHGLTFCCVYRSGERTLTDEEVGPVHGLVSNMLVERFGAMIR